MSKTEYITNDVFWAALRENHVMEICGQSCIQDKNYQKAEEYFRLALKFSSDAWKLFRDLNPQRPKSGQYTACLLTETLIKLGDNNELQTQKNRSDLPPLVE